MAVTLTPALATQEFFETYAGLAREGRSTGRGIPRNPLQAAVWLHALRREMRLTGPAALAQRLPFPILAVLGRRRAYRPRYSRSRATPA